MPLEIVKYGDPILRTKGKQVSKITPEIEQLVTDMLETMRENAGVGLAAQQVGKAIQLTVIDTRQTDRPSTLEIDGKAVEPASMMPLVLINPVVNEAEGEQIGPEGCLSFPEITAEIRRADRVRVEATNLKGERFRFHCTGLLSRAAQHEVDHLNGILFIDRMDSATKAGLSGRLKRLQKETKKNLKRR